MAGHRAGASAEDVAQRARAKVAGLEQWAESWEAGAAGERATAEVLAGLDAAGWSVLHDVAWPGRQWANLDHVAVGPAGVFVIDTKNWSGRVEVREGVLRQNGRSREPAVVGAAEGAVAILELVPDVPVHAVICLVGQEPRRGWIRDVMLCSTTTLREMLESRPAVLSPDDVSRVAGTLRGSFSSRTPERPERPRRSSADVTPKRPTSRSRFGPSLARLAALVLAVVLLLGALQTGLISAAIEKVAGYIAQTITDNRGTTDTPVEEPARRKDGRQREQREQQGRRS